MDALNQHWDDLFIKTPENKLGWYEDDISQTIKFLDKIETKENSTVFLAGAGTSKLADYLHSKEYKLILNDISKEALDKLDERLQSKDLNILHHDISKPLPENLTYSDIWIDRAVLHFLLEDKQIDTYFENLKNNLKHGGYALFAQFALDGAPTCAGLELHRYSQEELSNRLGDEFKLIAKENYTFINPFGDKRAYIYALYKRD